MVIGWRSGKPVGVGKELWALSLVLHLSCRGCLARCGCCEECGGGRRCAFPLPGPPWAISAGPVAFPCSITQGKAEMKPGGPQTELCGCFIMCLLGTLRGTLVQYLGFLLTLPKGRGLVARSPGDFPLPRFGSRHTWQSPTGPAVFRVPGLSPEQGVSLLVEVVGGARSQQLRGEPEEPRIFSLCSEQRVLPTPMAQPGAGEAAHVAWLHPSWVSEVSSPLGAPFPPLGMGMASGLLRR